MGDLAGNVWRGIVKFCWTWPKQLPTKVTWNQIHQIDSCICVIHYVSLKLQLLYGYFFLLVVTCLSPSLPEQSNGGTALSLYTSLLAVVLKVTSTEQSASSSCKINRQKVHKTSTTMLKNTNSSTFSTVWIETQLHYYYGSAVVMYTVNFDTQYSKKHTHKNNNKKNKVSLTGS